eukprot:scaffold206_cov400-Prasinococcus_capsulatus_cf.AAC.13
MGDYLQASAYMYAVTEVRNASTPCTTEPDSRQSTACVVTRPRDRLFRGDAHQSTTGAETPSSAFARRAQGQPRVAPGNWSAGLRVAADATPDATAAAAAAATAAARRVSRSGAALPSARPLSRAPAAAGAPPRGGGVGAHYCYC